MSEVMDKIRAVAAAHNDHSAKYGVFEYLTGLREWVDTDRGKQCFLPSGPLHSMDYGRGFLCLSFIPEDKRTNDCTVTLVSVDDAGMSAFGKPPNDAAVIKVLDHWRTYGLPGREDISKQLQGLGLHADWW